MSSYVRGDEPDRQSHHCGNHTRWSSEVGHVQDVIVKKYIRGVEYKGRTRHATRAEPQYEIKSDKSNQIAMHKGPEFRKEK